MRQSRVILRLSLLLLSNVLIWINISAQTNPGKIVFYRESTWQLLAINADGTGQTALTSGGNLRDSHPVFSPDGTKIAFDRTTSAQTHIFIMNADGTNPVAVTSGTN